MLEIGLCRRSLQRDSAGFHHYKVGETYNVGGENEQIYGS